MASLAPSSSNQNPIPIWTPSPSEASFPDEEDSCSICLEPFCSDDPSTITSCKHDYHLHCILEWSQRSKECPVCWQLLSLKDPASQGILDAVQNGKRSRARNDSFSDDSDWDERIMQQLTVVSTRARFALRRERQRYSGMAPSRCFNFSHVENVSALEEAHPTSPEERPHFASRSPTYPRVLFGQPTPDGSQRQSLPETLNFPESIKSKLSAASARYKESISKGTRGLKEKLFALNNSVKELSKGVQHEMTAGITGVARMFERLDLTSKNPRSRTPGSSDIGETSDFSARGKVSGNVSVKSSGRIADQCSEAPPSHIIRST